MANLWKNDKQLKIIKMSWKEYVAVTDSWGLCDICGDNSSEEPLYFVALVNQCYCPDCFDGYYKGAKRYRGDIEKEQKNYVEMKNRLNDLGVWNE